MCGIIGYVGKKDPVPILLKGLKVLEYRGYDSAGIALLNKEKLQVVKEKGNLKALKEKLTKTKWITSHLGIAHTRWATHGLANVQNAHPHTVGKITIVHNGIVENALELKEMLLKKGYTFQTETDTEVLAALLEDYDEGNLLEAIRKSCEVVRGSYALGILKTGDSDHLYAIRKSAPLMIGISKEEKYIASDIGALLPFTDQVIELPEQTIAILSKENVQIVDFLGEPLEVEIQKIPTEEKIETKMGYDHYMLKEIMEEPALLKKMLLKFASSKEKLFETLPDISSYEEIHIVGCGSALYAGMIGKYLLEEYAKVKVFVEVASEYRYQNTIYDRKTLVILISQSGETADTLAALEKVKSKKIPTIGIVNVKTSTLAKNVEIPILIEAGREVAVATTKAYMLQVLMLSLLAFKIAFQKKFLTEKTFEQILEELKALPSKVQQVLQKDLHPLALELSKEENIFFIGRGIDFAIGLEGSLKLKEVSYIHSEAYQAGELKHGTISLIREGFPVLAIITSQALKEKTISNLKETEARGAKTVVVTTEDIEEQEAFHVLKIDSPSPFLKPFLVIPLLQLFAYEVAKIRGCTIDQPKNLAKSVTVE